VKCECCKELRAMQDAIRISHFGRNESGSRRTIFEKCAIVNCFFWRVEAPFGTCDSGVEYRISCITKGQIPLKRFYFCVCMYG
jgi:hypothetical protein